MIESKKSEDGKPESLSVKRRDVKVLARNLTLAAIQGLEAGAQLVSLAPDGLSDGARVRLPPEVKPGEVKP